MCLSVCSAPEYMLCLHSGKFDHPNRMFNRCTYYFVYLRWRCTDFSCNHNHLILHILTSAKAEVTWSCRFVCEPFILSHSVCVQHYCKSNHRFHWNLVLWLGLLVGRIDLLLMVIGSQIQIPDYFSIRQMPGSKSGLIQKSGFEPRITFCWD